MQQTVKQRLKHYLKQRNYKQIEFAESLGLSSGYVNAIRNSISSDVIDKIKEKYNELNIDWLLHGKGEMISMEGKSTEQSEIREADSPYGRKQDGLTQLSEETHMEVEFRDLSVAAGPLSRTDEVYPKTTLLVPKEYDNGEYLVVRVDGPSMDDGTIYSIPSGANILIKRHYLHNGDSLPIRDNLFVIDAKDGQALKQIIEHNTEEGYIICRSYNPEFSDYKVEMDDVFAFYIFRKIVGFRPPVRGI